MALDERAFFDEKLEMKPATLNCPHCRQAGEYELGWFVRTKKAQIPRGADERDRARYAKLRSYMLRRDDMTACKNPRCRKRFDISGIQSVVFME
jgi:sarcosine oxidase delta subunit